MQPAERKKQRSRPRGLGKKKHFTMPVHRVTSNLCGMSRRAGNVNGGKKVRGERMAELLCRATSITLREDGHRMGRKPSAVRLINLSLKYSSPGGENA